MPRRRVRPPARELRVCRPCESDGRSLDEKRNRLVETVSGVVSTPPPSSSRRREPPGGLWTSPPEFADWQPLVDLGESSPGSYFSSHSDDLVEIDAHGRVLPIEGPFLTEAKAEFRRLPALQALPGRSGARSVIPRPRAFQRATS
ncbi:hypothetical protein THAOC_29782 [Thalassiosira oceanica]|uniref:Uncharacterized protein n=1 Tax=Thalassiosira oceanica TaxID=159749 RepID=K0RWE8_THAOC|nr:hypothetical protein THAOC_29782 [Thalassiosira oceanica]|eukprot:EJK51082.1 hypothetical protein THAOC_29782 [Thalassiosira oceanica]